MNATQHKHSIGTSANQKQVYAYLTAQPLAGMVSRNPHLLTLVKEALSSHRLAGETACLEHDMGRPIGYSELAKVQDKDVIFYAKLLKTDDFTKFVKHHRANHTSILTIKLKRDQAGDYEVVCVRLGNDYPAMPGDPEATAASGPFWEKHAVIFNGQAIIASTITKDRPY
jgi:hypothetical protein